MPESSPEAPSTPTFPAQPPEGRAARIFLGKDGLRVGWSLLLYVAFWLLIDTAIKVLAVQIAGFEDETYKPQSLAPLELLSFLSSYAASLLMARFEQRSVKVYGLPWKQAFGKLFWLGCLLGLGEVSLLVGSIGAFGGYSFGKISLYGTSLPTWALYWAVTFVFVGLTEEFLFRGYAQYTLTRGIGFWPAAVGLSLLFGAGHLANHGETVVGAANVVVTGLVFAFALKRTGNLWLAVGWHAAFDFGETFLFSVPNSGLVYSQHLSNASLEGPSWLTGGTVGPEGSVFGFLTMGLGALAIHFLFPIGKLAPCDAGTVKSA